MGAAVPVQRLADIKSIGAFHKANRRISPLECDSLAFGTSGTAPMDLMSASLWIGTAAPMEPRFGLHEAGQTGRLSLLLQAHYERHIGSSM
jgi:hypothetical protein